MALILSIETATTICSIALHKEGKLLGSQSLHIAQSHATLLVPSIESLTKYCGFTLRQIDAIAISKGPGSYTGLRIGVSTAKGLCDGLDIPLISINTLKAMTAGVSKYMPPDVLLCPMIDARRMEVYCLLTNKELDILQETKPMVIDESSFKEWLDKTQVYFFGNGASKCKAVINHPNAKFIDHIEPDAINIGALAYEKFRQNEFEDVAYFTPFYLKDFRVTKPKAK